MALALVVAFLLGAGTVWTYVTVNRAFSASSTSNGTSQGSNYPYPTYPSANPNNPYNPGNSNNPYNPYYPGSGAGSNNQSGQGGTASVTQAQSTGIVFIDTQVSGGVGAGTGMVLTSSGEVLTCYHVVAGSSTVSVTVADTNKTYSATVLGFDSTKDVALLQLKNASGLPTITVDPDQLSVGDTVSAVGNASGGAQLVRADGKVQALDQKLTVSSESPWGATENLSGMIETNAMAVPGDSGGPMFDSQNEVTGMTTAGSTDDSTSYATPISVAMGVVTTIKGGQDSGTVQVGPSGYLGITVDTTMGGQGQMIGSVVPGGPADKIGIVAGSTLTSVGSTTVTSDTNLADVIRVLKPGSRVSVTWITPNGTRKSGTATVGASPLN